MFAGAGYHTVICDAFFVPDINGVLGSFESRFNP